MKPLPPVLIQVKSDLTYLEKVLSSFEKLKENSIEQKQTSIAMDTRIWLECQLALAEGFTNAVRHAHRDKSIDTPIDIEIMITQKEITIKIWDYGQPFDLIQFSTENKQMSESLGIGGRGIEIMRQIADELKYDRHNDDRNCLTIKKKIIN